MRERGRVCERVRGRQGETGRQGEGEIEKNVREGETGVCEGRGQQHDADIKEVIVGLRGWEDE